MCALHFCNLTEVKQARFVCAASPVKLTPAICGQIPAKWLQTYLNNVGMSFHLLAAMAWACEGFAEGSAAPIETRWFGVSRAALSPTSGLRETTAIEREFLLYLAPS